MRFSVKHSYDTSTADLCADESFGPLVSESCPRGADLTVLFQETVLSLGPGIFILVLLYIRLVAARTVNWWPSKKVTTWKYWIKQGIYTFHFILAGLIVIFRHHVSSRNTGIQSQQCVQTSMSYAADLISAISALFLLLNASLEMATTSWSTSPRPITMFLMIGLASDFLRARTMTHVCKISEDLGALPVIPISSGTMYFALGLFKFLAAISEQFRPSTNMSSCAEDNAGLLSRLAFVWLYSTIRRGYRSRLKIRDLPTTRQSIQIQCAYGIRNTVLDNSCPSLTYSGSRFALHRKILRSLCVSIAIPITLRVLLLVTLLAQPMIIKAILEFTETPQSSNGVTLLFAVVLAYPGAALLSGAYWHAVDSEVTRLRGLLFAAIYKRALLSRESEEDGNGAMISLLSSDVDAILQGFRWAHEIWATFITAAISMWMLYSEVGLAFISPLVCIFGVTAISSYLSKYLKSLQQKWLHSTAERTEYTLYVLRNMLGIKMSGMSGEISQAVLKYRDLEVHKSNQFRKMLSLLAALANVSTLGITLATLATFAMISRYTGEDLNATKMFSALAILQLPMSSLQALISTVPLMGAAMASLQRIQEYLASGESSSSESAVLMLSDMSGTRELKKPFAEMKAEARSVFSIKNGTIGWASSSALLNNVSFEIQSSQICFIVGKAGSGKSSLLDIIMGRTQALKSVTSMTKDFTHAAYCQQSPWFPNETVQNVIIGAEKYDHAWFSHVLSLCCLTEDITHLRQGLMTLVGADGTGLSGGQKKRIALARAIYSRNKVLILDDPLSSLDANSERAISDALFGPRGFFRSVEVTVILTTSVVKHLHLADRVFEIQGGELFEQPLSKVPVPDIKLYDFETASVDHIGPPIPNEDIDHDVTSGTFRHQRQEPSSNAENGPGPNASWEEHILYVSSLGKRNLIIFFVLTASIAFASLARSFELKRISQYYSHNAYDHLGLYIGLVCMTLLFIFSWSWHFFIHGVGTSSTQLHKIQWKALINSPMSFFTTTEQGEIMNSFSQDLRFVDKELPTAFSTSAFAISLVVINVLITILASKFAAIAIPFLGLAFWILCRAYLRISYQLRLLDLNSVSPIFSHAIETMQGTRTIHSFGWIDHFYTRFLHILDDSQRPYYALLAIQQLLQVVLDLFVAIIAIITCATAVALKDSADTGFLGLALTSLLTLGASLKMFVRSFTDLETSIGAMGRINKFVTTAKSEHDHDGCRRRAYDASRTSESMEEWPRDGSISFEEFTASHALGGNPIIRNINLNIAHGQRVAICGRSGSGKTSLVSSIFSLLNTTSGQLIISGVPTSNLCVETLRMNIAGLPQDTFFLPGSVRDNFRVYYNRGRQRDSENLSDEPAEDRLTVLMADSLRILGLYEKIADAGGLDYAGISLKTLLSHGERQLFNLARLSISSSPIVVMDEATSSIDDERELVARAFIRKRFKGKTILGVVHRLGGLVEEDWDSYVLMEAGLVAETGKLNQQERGEKFIQLTASSTRD